MKTEQTRKWLQEYYGRRIKKASDLVQKACCTTDTQRKHADILELIPDDVRAKHYGCGCPIPEDDLAGLTVLDLGSGAGVDVFIMSFKVGPSGFVHGVDMTEEQLAVSTRAIPTVMKRFGYLRANVEFHHGYIESVEGVADASVDLVISDCVVNLSPRKDLVFQSIHRVLKEGGEFYLSDIAADRRVPDAVKNDPVLSAECLGGAEYEHDWFDQMKAAGFADPRVVERRIVQEEAKGLPIVFSSLTVRGFKFCEPLDSRCEDYGQTAVYLGNLASSSARFMLDDHHVFEAGRPAPVCRNTARMLSETRLGKYFEVTQPIRHFGLFACGTPAIKSEGKSGSACC